MCPFCNSPFSRVILTERFATWIRRRRRCRSCGGEYHSKEEFSGLIKQPSRPLQLRFFQAAENGRESVPIAAENGK